MTRLSVILLLGLYSISTVSSSWWSKDQVDVTKRQREIEESPWHALTEFQRSLASTLDLTRSRLGFLSGLDLKTSPSAYHVSLDVPGLAPSEIHVTVDGEKLSISGRHECKEDKESLEMGCRQREVESEMILPRDAIVDKLNVELDRGVLKAHIPRVQPKDQEGYLKKVLNVKEKVRESAQSVSDKMAEGYEAMKARVMGEHHENFNDALRHAKEEMNYGYGGSPDHIKIAKERGEHMYENVKNAASNMYGSVKGVYDSVKTKTDQTKHSAYDAANAASDKAKYVKDTAEEYYDAATSKMSNAKKTTEGKMKEAKDKVTDAYESGKESAKEQVSKAYESSKENVNDIYADTKEKIIKGYDSAKEGASSSYSQAKDTASSAYDSVKEAHARGSHAAHIDSDESSESAQDVKKEGGWVYNHAIKMASAAKQSVKEALKAPVDYVVKGWGGEGLEEPSTES